MLSITAALLGERLTRPGQRLLDAGCGTGGFLRWRSSVAPSRRPGVDIGSAAIDLAQERLPDVQQHRCSAPLAPRSGSSFDLVVSNDVLQHVHEQELEASMGECGESYPGRHAAPAHQRRP